MGLMIKYAIEWEDRLRANWFYGLLVVMLLVGSIAIVLVPQEFLLIISVLLIGLPFAILVIDKRIRVRMVVLMLVLLPLTSIIKAISGVRFAPLTFDLGLLFAVVLYVGEGLVRGKLRAGRLDLLLFLFWGLAFVQMFNPNVPGLQAGVEGFRKFAFMSLGFYIGRHMLKGADWLLFMRGMLVVSGFVALYGLKQFVYMSPLDYRMIELATADPVTYLMGGWIRPFSTMAGPFQLGLYLMVTIFLLLSLLLNLKLKIKWQILFVGLMLLQGVVLITTRTKGNWVGLALGILVLVLLQSRTKTQLVKRLIMVSLLGVLLITGVIFLASGTILTVLQEAVFAVTNPLQAPTFIFRMQLWQEEIIPAIMAQPLFGYGTSSAGEGLKNLYEGTSAFYFLSHNLYIKVLLELGIIGLLIFLWLLFASLRLGWKNLARSKGHALTYSRFLWAFVTVFAFLVAGLVIPTLDAYPVNYYFWLLLGVLSVKVGKTGELT